MYRSRFAADGSLMRPTKAAQTGKEEVVPIVHQFDRCDGLKELIMNGLKLGKAGSDVQALKARLWAAHEAGLTAMMCVGESLKERKKGDTLKVVLSQLRSSLPAACTAKNTVIAYEPVWAIGTGLTPTVEQVEEVHMALRKAVVRRFGDEGAKMRILYGGSVKPANAAELMAVPNVNGALVGGASLTAKEFGGIIAAYY